MTRLSLALLLAASLVACRQQDDGRAPTARDFPKADRPVSAPAGSQFSTEQARDDRNEAMTVMDLAKIRPGMRVADIGAGEGYYTVRLAERVGPEGRVVAEDIDPDAMARLANRIGRDRLDNAYTRVGTADDPKLPANSFDRIFMVHMYHEVEEPYAFLWRLRPALRPGGQVIVVDVDRPTTRHGIAPQLLFCEFAAVGFKLVEFVRKPELAGYYAQFTAEGKRPEPDEIKPCSQAAVQQQAAAAGGGNVG
jgi:ubiquinone/menaquinone biosynthesis C-methylase UbiE